MTTATPTTPGQHPAMLAFLEHLKLRQRFHSARTIGPVLAQFHGWAMRAGFDPLLATADQLADYQTWLVTIYRSPAGKPLAKQTCSTRLAVLRGWYRWCCQTGLACIDPSRHIGVRVPQSRVVIREHLTLQEATAMVQAQAGVVTQKRLGTVRHAEALRNLAALCMTLATGRRISGIMAMRTANLDTARREVRVEQEKGRTGRVLPVAGWAVAVVEQYLREARPLLARGQDTPWLFLNQPGTGPVGRDCLALFLDGVIARTIRENPDLTDLPRKRITWHSLRVSFATMLFSNGCDIRSVNELMLHRNLSTTARYTPIPVEDLRQVFRVAHPRP